MKASQETGTLSGVSLSMIDEWGDGNDDESFILRLQRRVFSVFVSQACLHDWEQLGADNTYDVENQSA